MTTYTVKFERVGRNHAVPDLTVEAADVDELTEAAYRYAGRFLGSRSYEVVVNLEAMTGSVEYGRFGRFTIETDWEDNTGFWQDRVPSAVLERHGFTAYVRDERKVGHPGPGPGAEFTYIVNDDRDGGRVEQGTAPTVEWAMEHAAKRIALAYAGLVTA